MSFNHRPDVGQRGPDPLEYRHRYTSLRDYAQLLVLRYHHGRTRHSYYRQLRLLAYHFHCDPATLSESQVRDYFLHVKTVNHWKPKTIRQAAACAGLQDDDRVVSVPSLTFLVPRARVQRVFRARFRAGLDTLRRQQELPAIDPRVWQRDWGVKLHPFGDGQNAIKYLGAYVTRTALGDSRIRSITNTHVSFTWKDRAHGNVLRTETVPGVEFVTRYLRHVLPRGLKAVRHYGFCHPAANAKRERIAFHTGLPLLTDSTPAPPRTTGQPTCPCCGQPMKSVERLLPVWRSARGPPQHTPLAALR